MVDERLIQRVCYKIIEKQDGKYINYPDEVIVEQMRKPENLIAFLALFGEAIDITGKGIACHGLNDGGCNACTKKCTMDECDCIRRVLISILDKSKKCKVVILFKGSYCNHVPGEFAKKDADEICKFMNGKKTSENIEYTVEEAV